MPQIDACFDEHYAVALADAQSRILFLQAQGRLFEAVSSVNFAPGGDWSEATCGTNAIGTALAQKKPITIFDAEHFCESWQPYSCAGVPIRHPLSGQMIGALDLTTFTENFPDNALPLTMMLSKTIETELYYRVRLEQAQLEQCFTAFHHDIKKDTLLAIDRDGRVVRHNRDPEKWTFSWKSSFDWETYFIELETYNAEVITQPLPFFAKRPIGNVRLIRQEQHLIGVLVQIPCERKDSRKFYTGVQPPSNSDTVGRDPRWIHLVNRVERAAQQDVPILLLGESGTGKEVLARRIHQHSARKEGPFLPVNCAALHHSLAASEWFGYGEGTFTGGLKQGKPGWFENADGGTLFLDEIGELPLPVQAMLLRTLQEHQVTRIGEAKPRDVQVRVIAATNKDLREAVRKKEFRSDLYFRLNTITFTIPPLRERPDDIPLLAEHLMRQVEIRQRMDIVHTLSPEAIKDLKRYPWPGNVRELKNALEHALVFADGPVIRPEHLPNSVRETEGMIATDREIPAPPSTDEKEYLKQLLASTEYNLSKTARILGIARGTLYKRLKKYGLR